MRLFIVVGLACCFASTPSATAEWLQAAHDSARTGAAESVGPEWPDVALATHTPLEMYNEGETFQPLIIDGKVYVSAALPPALQDPARTNIIEIDPITSVNRTVAALDIFIGNIAASHERIFFTGDSKLGYVVIDTGELKTRSLVTIPEETYPHPLLGFVTSATRCLPPAITEAEVYVGCLHAGRGGYFVHGYTHDLEPIMTWDGEPRRPGAPSSTDDTTEVDYLTNTAAPFPNPSCGDCLRRDLIGLTVADETLILSYRQAVLARTLGTTAVPMQGTPEITSASVLGIRRADGELLWWNQVGTAQGAADMPSPPPAPSMAATWDGQAFYKFEGALVRQDLVAPDPKYNSRLELDKTAFDDGSGVAIKGDALYVAQGQTLQRLKPGLEQVWAFRNETVLFERGALAVDDRCVYAKVKLSSVQSALVCIDPELGTESWRFSMGVEPLALSNHDSFGFAVASEIVAIQTNQGEVFILGKTRISPVVRASIPTSYPEVARLVKVDLSGSSFGLTSERVEYMADWGDGRTTTWQPSPVLSHAYLVGIDATARFYTRNAANQTSSTTHMFHVGQPDPGVTLLTSPLHREYQETTFFIIGLIVTGGLGLFGVYRAGRKRRLLERELRHVTVLRDRHANNQDQLQHLLAERRSWAHQLYVSGKLDDGQVQVLERRIDEVAGRARLSRVAEEFGFLPVSLARTLEDMLHDGRVNSRERRMFLTALEAQRALTARQKAKVRTLVEQWFAADAKG